LTKSEVKEPSQWEGSSGEAMDRLRENLNPEEAPREVPRPTRYRSERNRHELSCAACGEHYYVDDETLRKATAVREGDESDIAFYCEDCEEEGAEDEHSVRE
jgi:hypothetical protein